MATRDRKLSIGRRQQTSSSPLPKDIPPSPSSNLDKIADKSETINSTSSDNAQTALSVKTKLANRTPLVRKLKGSTKKTAGGGAKKITLSINHQKAKRKVNQKIAKTLINSASRVLGAAKLLKGNTAKTRTNRKTKEAIIDDGPPVLEPIFPIEDNLDKKTTKRKVVRNPLARKIKLEEEINGSVDKTNKKTKIKTELQTDTISETIEGVVSGISSPIPPEIKEEPLSDPIKIETKSKKLTKRQLSLLQKEIKKENIENTEIGPNDQKVIDMLDLNVLNLKKPCLLPVIRKRRHTIEKFQLDTSTEINDEFSHFTIFPSLPNNSRTKRKPRGPIEGKVINPYTIRPPSARLLRNGKQRKLKDQQLLDGLDMTRKRRRICSDLSYDSDSSYSDLSSITTSEPSTHEPQLTPSKDLEIKRELVEQEENLNLLQPTEIKRSLSTENRDYCTDTNSNELKAKKPPPELLKPHEEEMLLMDDEEINNFSTPSAKVPEKLLILDIMKQTFNENLEIDTKACQNAEIVTEPEEEKKMSEIISKIVETMGTEEFTATINTTEDGTALVMQNVNGSSSGGGITTSDWSESKKIPPNVFENDNMFEQESEEEVSKKENILKALGLQSLKAAEEAKLEKDREKTVVGKDILNATSTSSSPYTGTLKTVIKLNRDKKKGKQPLKMTLQKNKTKNVDGDDYKIMKEGGSSSWKNSVHQSSDTAGAHRKTHYSNRSNPPDGSSEHTSDGETQGVEGPVKSLVIPEKASSFSIHPERLCKDECSYCFGKFGLFDTPCHIAQIKSVERQDKILSIEKHLTRDSCLCDACYRHIDRKANTPSYTSKSFKRGPMIAPGPKENHCHVLGCDNVSTNVLRRKWIIKMKKQICQVINIDLDNPGLHSIPICDEHYVALEHLMVCAMCKRRLARNHIHYLGPEVEDLNAALQKEEIPLNLSDKPVVCKLCKCFATIIMKNPDERPENSSDFFIEYKKRLLHFNNIVPMDEADAEEPLIVPSKEREPMKKKRKSSKNDNTHPNSPPQSEQQTKNIQNDETQHQQNSRPESPSDYLVDFNSLIPSIAMECEEDEQQIQHQQQHDKHPVPMISLHKRSSSNNSIDSTKNSDTINNNDQLSTVQKLGSNPSLSVRQLFPGEEDLGLQAHIDFANVKEKTPEGWGKCKMTLQYDKETKQLWQELQKPYGNQSSFMRHLILLEKYFRNGDLELKSNASQQSITYSECVQNRLRSYDNIPTGASVKPLNLLGLNKQSRETSLFASNNNVSITSIKQASTPSPVTITQLKNMCKNKPPPPPPGLISLLPGTIRQSAALKQQFQQQPQSQKIKFPITKNWRPTLIPIDPNKPPPEKKTGLVQVISGGKPYHITLEDYKKMCAIKRSFEMKQKRQQEIQKRTYPPSNALLKTMQSKNNNNKMMPKIEPKVEQETAVSSPENILEKLDQQVENLEVKFNEAKTLSLNMPKIPKSLTVIPQTVTRRNSRPVSPILMITQKTQQNLISNCNKS